MKETDERTKRETLTAEKRAELEAAKAAARRIFVRPPPGLVQLHRTVWEMTANDR